MAVGWVLILLEVEANRANPQVAFAGYLVVVPDMTISTSSCAPRGSSTHAERWSRALSSATHLTHGFGYG